MEIEIVSYIKEARQHGLSDQEIKQNLLNVGWDPGQVEDSFSYAKLADNKPDVGPAASAIFPAAGQTATAQHSAELPKLAGLPTRQDNAQTAAAYAQATLIQPIANLSDKDFENSAAAQPKRKSVLLPAIITALAVLILGAGGYFAYAYFVPTPANIWNRAMNAKKSSIVASDFVLSYKGPGGTDDSGAIFPLDISVTGKSYVDATNTSSPSGSVYLDLGYHSTSSSNFSSELGNQSQTQMKLQKELADILKKNQVVTATKILGTETVSGQATYHLQNQLNKTALKQVMNSIFDVAASSTALSEQERAGAIKQVISTVIDQINITTFETWIGKKDSQIYKISLQLQFASLDSLLGGTSSSTPQALSNPHDTKRLADIRQMQSALELYYNDHNGYPAAQNGAPQGLDPVYITKIPVSPEPANGACSEYYNAYWYTPTGTPHTTNGLVVYPSYEYSFCLGTDTGKYKAGIAKATDTGITDALACNDTPEHCAKTSTITQQAAKPGPATLSMQITYSNYGQKMALTPPADSFDLVKYISDQMKKSGVTENMQTTNATPDAKRLNDVRQFATDLELYFSNKNRYPDSLSELAPAYMGSIPTAPIPPGGSCTNDQNTYIYTVGDQSSPSSPKQAGSNYTLTFCLGSDTSGYKAGPHTLSPMGIQ